MFRRLEGHGKLSRAGPRWALFLATPSVPIPIPAQHCWVSKGGLLLYGYVLLSQGCWLSLYTEAVEISALGI
jgi:hypothetical protein